jgi:hypothetical protein
LYVRAQQLRQLGNIRPRSAAFNICDQQNALNFVQETLKARAQQSWGLGICVLTRFLYDAPHHCAEEPRFAFYETYFALCPAQNVANY